MQNKPKTFYTKSTLGIHPYSMRLTGKIIHCASRRYLQSNEEPFFISFTTDFLLEMQFSFKHACPYYKSLFSPSTKHDHFLICETSQERKMKYLTSIEKEMNKLHTPPKLRNLILAQLKLFYHNTLAKQFSPEQIERCEITKSIALQHQIGWHHFIRGRFTLSYIPIVKNIL